MGKKYISSFNPIELEKEELKQSADKVDKKLFNNIRFESDSITFSHWVEMLADYIEQLQNQTEKAKKELAEFNKDSEIQYWKELYETANLEKNCGFPITKEQYEKIEAWQEKHDAEKHNLKNVYERVTAGGAIGGRYFYRFTPTSIGVSGECVCGICHRVAITEAKGESGKYRKLIEKMDGSFTFQDL